MEAAKLLLGAGFKCIGRDEREMLVNALLRLFLFLASVISVLLL